MNGLDITIWAILIPRENIKIRELLQKKNFTIQATMFTRTNNCHSSIAKFLRFYRRGKQTFTIHDFLQEKSL